MVYETTDFWGMVQLSSPQHARKVLEALKGRIGPCANWSDVSVDLVSATLRVDTSAKNWGHELEKFCVFVAVLDPGAEGEILSQGEEWDDLWRIRVGGGEVWLDRGEVRYIEETRFLDVYAVRSARLAKSVNGCRRADR